ncbi:MAG: MFS transporter [Endomicrobium sp.]|jgi:MFS family permease|nr:MFS transporter [Endomicrobium sp.]
MVFYRKIISCLILTAFVISFIFNDLFAYGYEGANSGEYIEMPESLSSVVEHEFYGNDVLIVYISDLHNNFFAQEKIVKLIDFYDGKKRLKGIFAEGAPAGKVKLSLFEGLDENIKKGILDRMLKNGQIGACEYYVSYNKKDILYGMEDAKLYADNLELIKRMLEIYDENIDFFNMLEKKSNTLKRKHISASMLKINNALEENYEDSYSKINDFFKNDKNFESEKYKDFLNYLKIKEESVRIKSNKANEEFSQINKYAVRNFPYNDYNEFSSLAEKGKTETQAQIKLYEMIAKKIPDAAELFPHAFKALEMIYLKYKVNNYNAYIQKKELQKYIIENYASDTEKEIFFLSGFFEALKRIYSLEITRDELINFINAKEKFKKTVKKYIDTAESNTVSYLAENEVTNLIYANNLKRDEIFFKSVKEIVNLENSQNSINQNGKINNLKDFKDIYIVVAGGFHEEFRDFLKNNNISYINLMPKFQDLQPEREKYFDAIRMPGKLGVKNLPGANSAFAPPLLNILNSKADNDMKEVMLKNIIAAWVESAAQYSVGKKEVYADIYSWLKNNGIDDETIYKYDSLKEVAEFAQAYDTDNSKKVKRNFSIKETKIYSKIKNFFDVKIKKLFRSKGKLSFPKISLGSSYMRDALSSDNLIEMLKEAKKNKIKNFEFAVKKSGEEFYFELENGTLVAFKEILAVIDDESNNIIIRSEKNSAKDYHEIFNIIDENKNRFTLISGDKEFLSSSAQKYKKIKFIYDISGFSGTDNAAQHILSFEDLDIDGIYADAETFNRSGAYFTEKTKGKKFEIFLDITDEHNYADFIFRNKNSITLICKDFSKYNAQRKDSRTAYRNIAATPLLQLVIGFEFFASFSTIYLQGAGYGLSFLGLFFALAGPLSVAGSVLSGFLSRRLGQRNVIIANLLLHCAGDAILLLAAISPVFLALGIGVPAMAAAGVATLLIPFLHSSLEKTGQAGKFETVYGKTRSIFWVGLALSSVTGSWLAQYIGYAGVIALSCVIITALSVYSFFSTGSLKNISEDKAGSETKESKKILQAVKTVFKIKDIKSIVILNFIVDTGLFVFMALAIQTMFVNAGLSVAWLGIIMFSANLVQSLASKIVKKVEFLINNPLKRTVYFSALAAVAAAFMVFNDPVLLIVFYLLANFWQGASSIIEPTKIEEHVSDDISPYWFSFKTAFMSVLSTGVQLLLCLIISNVALDGILFAVIGIVTAASAFLGFVVKNKKVGTDKLIEEQGKSVIYTKRLLACA